MFKSFIPFLLVSLIAATAFAQPIPAKRLARKPEFTNIQLSPNGQSIAYQRINDDDLISLEVLDLATGEKQGVAGTENYDVGGYSWVNDTQLAVILTKDKIYGVGLYVYDRDTGRLAAITEGGFGLVSIPRDRRNRVVARTGGDQGVLIEYTTSVDRKNKAFGSNFDPVKQTYPPPPAGRLRAYFADVTGEPVLAAVFKDGSERAYVLNREAETWSESGLDLETTPILAIAADRQLAWVARQTADGGSEIVHYDLAAGRFGEKVYQDSDYDLRGARLVLDRTGRTLRAIVYSRVRMHAVWFDDKLEQAHARISEALAGYDIVLVDRSRDEQRVIFAAVSSTEPGQYFLADLGTGAIQHIAASAPWLEGQPLSPTASFNYEARDGLQLQAYLTLPTGPKAQKPYPLMVLGHGGPWARDNWRFDPEVQFLASRGYAVLQPNYRGSTGFRAAVSLHDRFEFRKMHDDVTDAVRALVKGGIADPDQLGIMGASFGGYLAIAGAAWEPDLYRVAITNVGVFDWDMLISDSRRESYTSYHWLMKNIGNDPAKVAAFSPLKQVDDIRIPVFIAHGRQDIRVDISQSVRLERALKSNGTPHETYYEGDSAHGFAAAEAQAAYLEALDSFLIKYFPTNRAEVPVGTPESTD
ncbi:alpha/beta hydrolase family protein [Synoicihabitans lomoniglobus]|uniref:Acyl-peptide hydrolase n=1 Tax=Synoicihabitans lomoniglobus TaxID=2909285 RepID=A0AAF0CH60_9BACT|nr:prolyl oligopeptidase family serine peptidase [Opitutaceae bacterium LMO-M01]WED63917.1 prolyl oligopeptidase family serine peptidase [Opitutaceae bacterium LMO-M01]